MRVANMVKGKHLKKEVRKEVGATGGNDAQATVDNGEDFDEEGFHLPNVPYKIVAQGKLELDLVKTGPLLGRRLLINKVISTVKHAGGWDKRYMVVLRQEGVDETHTLLLMFKDHEYGFNHFQSSESLPFDSLDSAFSIQRRRSAAQEGKVHVKKTAPFTYDVQSESIKDKIAIRQIHFVLHLNQDPGNAGLHQYMEEAAVKAP